MAIQVPHFDDPKEKVAWLRTKMVELSVNSDNPAIEEDRASLDAVYKAALEDAGLADWTPAEAQRHPEDTDPFVVEHIATPTEPTEQLERLKEFSETDLVNLSQGLVSISRATTHDSAKVKEVYDRNAHLIEPYRLAPEEDAVLKVFNIFWQSHVCGQIVLQIKDNKGVISYWVDSKLSNRNIATNAVILLKEYAFDVLNLSHLEAYILPINVRSIRVIEKSGFYKTESVYKANTPTNASVSHLIYKIQPEAL